MQQAVADPTTTSRREFTAEDSLSFKVVSDAQISPDGSRVAFIVSDSFTLDAAVPPRSQLWIASRDGTDVKPFTTGIGNDRSPRWSPDGQALVFLSDRHQPGKFQLHIWSHGDGEARPLDLNTATEVGSGVYRVEPFSSIGTPVWSPDGKHLAFLMEDPLTEAEKRPRAPNDDAIEVGKNLRFSGVWTLDLTSQQTQRLTPDKVQVWDFDWARDGRLALIVSDTPEHASWYRARLAVLDKPLALKTVYSPPEFPTHGAPPAWQPALRRQIARPTWSPDGRSVAFISCAWSDYGLVGGDVYVVDPGGKGLRNLTDGQSVSVSWITWTANNRLMVACWQEGEQALALLSTEPAELSVVWRGEVAFGDRYQPRFSSSADGSIAVVREDPSRPREVWLLTGVVSRSPHWQQLTHLQPAVDDLAIAPLKTLHWKARDGQAIQGQVMLPAGYAGDHPLPMVTFTHGGPTFLHQFLFHGWPEGPYGLSLELFASAGMAVLLPNPRGSLGWGTAFAEALLGDHGGVDLDDILDGIDFCIAEGIADADRLGIAGWSTGGYLAPWATSRTDRFRAAFMGAGISDWRTKYAGKSTSYPWVPMFVPGNPYEVGGEYDRRSPIVYADRVKTPTLIVHGERDPLLSQDQAYGYYRALRDHGQSVELVIYPRENHAIREREHIIDASRRIVGWFKRWLKPPD